MPIKFAVGTHQVDVSANSMATIWVYPPAPVVPSVVSVLERLHKVP